MSAWCEEYRCGCVSDSVSCRGALLGYCSVHGSDRVHVWMDAERGGDRSSDDIRIGARIIVVFVLMGFGWLTGYGVDCHMAAAWMPGLIGLLFTGGLSFTL